MRIMQSLSALFALYIFLSFNSGCGTEAQPSSTPYSTPFNKLEITLSGASVNNTPISPANGQIVKLHLLLVPDITLNHENGVINVDPVVERYRCDDGSPGRDKLYPFGYSACFFEEFSLVPGSTTTIIGFFDSYIASVAITAPNLATHYRNFYPPDKRVYLIIDPNGNTIQATAYLQTAEDLGLNRARLTFKRENTGEISTLLVDRNRTQFPRDNVSRYQNIGVLVINNTLVLFR